MVNTPGEVPIRRSLLRWKLKSLNILHCVLKGMGIYCSLICVLPQVFIVMCFFWQVLAPAQRRQGHPD